MEMVSNTQNYWILGFVHRPLFKELESTLFWNWMFPPSAGKEKMPSLLTLAKGPNRVGFFAPHLLT
jgi:hypothetical protein